MNAAVKQESNWREIATFLAVAFVLSWFVWLVGIKAKTREELLLFGVAGPAFAAAFMLIRRRGAKPVWSGFSVGLFISLVPLCWVVLVLANAAQVHFRSFDWNLLLILPALLPAWSAAFFLGAGELRLQCSRWLWIAALSMALFLLIPALVAHAAGLPLVYPRKGESAWMTAGVAAIVFVKQLLFAGFLEEPGWRGWLLPRLQQRYSPLVSTLFVWLPWALWHAPLDFTGSVGRTWLNYVQVRVVFFIAISILLTWLYNRSRGSILVVALFHTGFNTFPFVLPYSPPFLALILVWAACVVITDKMWRLTGRDQAA